MSMSVCIIIARFPAFTYYLRAYFDLDASAWLGILVLRP